MLSVCLSHRDQAWPCSIPNPPSKQWQFAVLLRLAGTTMASSGITGRPCFWCLGTTRPPMMASWISRGWCWAMNFGVMMTIAKRIWRAWRIMNKEQHSLLRLVAANGFATSLHSGCQWVSHGRIILVFACFCLIFKQTWKTVKAVSREAGNPLPWLPSFSFHRVGGTISGFSQSWWYHKRFSHDLQV